MPTRTEQTTAETPTTAERDRHRNRTPQRHRAGEGTRKEKGAAPHPATGARFLWGVAWAVLLLACWLRGGGPDPPGASPALLPTTSDAPVPRPPARAPAPHTGSPAAPDTAPQPQHD
ncbi:hypothetical protein [Streptomyces sp. NPDC093097]|uniref:hypothetical protein n=1 Tax=Streptomyces sp. NPDC093097 TaxID=3366027 RepID=UPI00380ED481